MLSLTTWIKYVHVLGGFTFLFAHGASAFVAFRLKKEEDPTRMKALMDVSASSWPIMMLSLLVLLFSGIINAFVLGIWGKFWIWGALLLLLALTFWMFSIGTRTYHPLRRMLGMEYLVRGKPQPVEVQRPVAEIKEFISKTRPQEMLLIGIGGFALILWLMIFKPF